MRSDGGSFAFPIDTGLASRLEGLGLLNASSLVNSCNAGKESVLYNLIPTPVQSLDRFAVTRSTVKWVLGQGGVLTSIPANTPAFEYNTDGTYRGLLVEPAGTNQIRNNTGVGAVAGTPGTLPTNWGENLGGLTRAVVGTGTENGVEYIDLRFSGTATATSCELRFESGTQIVAANGETWTVSFFAKIIAQPAPPVTYRTYIIENTSGGGFVTGGTSIISPTTTTLSRFSGTRTLSGGGTVARVAPAFAAIIVSGQSYDFTIRIGLPQMEQSAVATSVVKTSGTSLTRTADSVTLTGASSLIGQTGGTFFVEFDYTQNAAERRILSVTDGTVTNRLIVWTLNNILYFTANTGTSTILLNPVPTGINRVAVNYNISGGNTAIRASVNGGSIVSATQVATPINLSRYDFGNREDGALSYNGRLRAIVAFPTILADAQLQALTA